MRSKKRAARISTLRNHGSNRLSVRNSNLLLSHFAGVQTLLTSFHDYTLQFEGHRQTAGLKNERLHIMRKQFGVDLSVLALVFSGRRTDAAPEVDTSGRKPYPKAWLVTWQSKRAVSLENDPASVGTFSVRRVPV